MSRLMLVLLTVIMIGLLACSPAIASTRSLVGPRGFYQEVGGVGGTMGYVSVALIVLVILMGFVIASKTLMKNVKPTYRKWLRRAHGFLGVAAIVTIIIHVMTVEH